MDFDIDNFLNKTRSKKNTTLEFTLEEINFMKNIFEMIVLSEDYDSKIKYLSGIYNISVDDINIIKNIYLTKYADKELKEEYLSNIKRENNIKKKEGFTLVSAIICFTIFISVFSITLALILYN